MMDELEQIKRLAGVNEFKGFKPVNIENITHTAAAIRQKERDLGLKPGDKDWFKLWFTLPYMTGSVNSHFRGRKK
jgi:hypothetical protein